MTIHNMNNRKRRRQRRLVYSAKGLARLYMKTNYGYGHDWFRCKPQFKRKGLEHFAVITCDMPLEELKAVSAARFASVQR